MLENAANDPEQVWKNCLELIVGIVEKELEAIEGKEGYKSSKKHENTENNNKSVQIFHHPPMKVAQAILNKPNEEYSLDCTYFELDLHEALQILNVTQATYQHTKNGNFYLVTFCIDVSNVEAALICLQSYGIGNTEFTSISVVPTSIHIDCPEKIPDDDLVQG